MKNAKIRIVAFALMLVMLMSSFAGVISVAADEWDGWFTYKLWGAADTTIGVTQEEMDNIKGILLGDIPIK